MDLVNLCLKIPNLGILIFFLIFIVIIPYVLIYSQNIGILKYYMTMIVAFAHLLTRVGDSSLFGNLYQLNPIEFVPFITANFINIFALFGILWQCIEFSRKYSLANSVIYGILLFIIALPFARIGLKFVLENIDLYLKDKSDVEYKHNWHLIVFGLLYIIFILGLQAILLTLVGFSGELKYGISSNNSNVNNKSNKSNKSNINNKSNTGNPINRFLKKFTLSNVSNFNNKIKK
jgi:hypothetical protein